MPAFWRLTDPAETHEPWFLRDAEGGLVPWRVDSLITPDYAAPGYQSYVADARGRPVVDDVRYECWMRFGRRGAGAPTGRDVDQLSDLADEAALRRPDTPEAVDAARRAVEAAERLLERDGSLSSQRRLARALWRQVSTFAMPAERDAIEQTALRCWVLCVGMLEAARGDAVAFDDVVGDLGMWAGVLVPALGLVGRHADAAQVYETSATAAGRAMGARGRQARARSAVECGRPGPASMRRSRFSPRWLAKGRGTRRCCTGCRPSGTVCAATCRTLCPPRGQRRQPSR